MSDRENSAVLGAFAASLTQSLEMKLVTLDALITSVEGATAETEGEREELHRERVRFVRMRDRTEWLLSQMPGPGDVDIVVRISRILGDPKAMEALTDPGCPALPDPCASVTWSITTGQLNVLWGDLFNRLAPIHWAGGPPLPTTSEWVIFQTDAGEPLHMARYHFAVRALLSAYGAFLRGDWSGGRAYPGLSAPDGSGAAVLWERALAVWEFLGLPAPVAGDQPAALDETMLKSAPAVTPKFNGLITMVLNYLGILDPDYLDLTTAFDEKGFDTTMPIRVLRGEGYDFLLSNDGLDLIVPPNPFQAPVGSLDNSGMSLDAGSDPEKRSIYLKYTYRLTGARPIGVPAPCDLPTPQFAGSSAASLPSPFGPSRLEISTDAILPLLSYVAASTGQPLLVDSLSKMVADDPMLDTFAWMIGPGRCWQLSGALYRGIFSEWPRIVAMAWFEMSAGMTLGDSYNSRYSDGGDSGLRSIFDERLEVVLPRANDMLFEASPLPDSEARITNLGITFPDLCSNPPDRVSLTRAWIAGTAGNPIFTDSVICN